MSQPVVKPENRKRHRTQAEYDADQRFYRWLRWGSAIVVIAVIVGTIWIMVEESTKSVRVVDPSPTVRVWSR